MKHSDNMSVPFAVWFAVLAGVAAPTLFAWAQQADGPVIRYTGDGSDLQEVLDEAPANATVACDRRTQLVLQTAVVITRPITLRGLNATLPKGLGQTSLLIVDAAGVTITDIELHGNYESVSQDVRAPLMKIHAGRFRLERCKFYDSSKDGVEIVPNRGAEDIVGGVIQDIEAFRIGRDAVSITGGNRGRRVRDVSVENVSLKKGYLRGAVEVSDGTDNIHVRNVYAEQCVYAVDVQDHGKGSAPNTNVTIEGVEAVHCRHIVRTANRPLGHASLTLRNLTGRECDFPVQISNTNDVVVDGLEALEHKSARFPPIGLKNCQGVKLRNVSVESRHFAGNPVQSKACTDLTVENLETEALPQPNGGGQSR